MMEGDETTSSLARENGVRVLYLGMLGDFSRIPLAALLAAGVDVCGVLVPADEDDGRSSAAIVRQTPPPTPSELPMRTPYPNRNIVHLAWEREIPVYAVRHPGHDDALAVVSTLQPDVAFVACFTQRLPALFLAVPPEGVLNLHPSLLPHYRGPAPLFWLFRQGGRETGVTLHFMDEGLDTGDIVFQAPVALPDGVSGAEADRRCARRGAELMVDAVRRLQAGDLPRRPQPAGGSYYPWPTTADFRIRAATWSARRAFNFIRGTAEWNQPYVIEVAGKEVVVSTAVAYQKDKVLEQTLVWNGRDVWVQCNPGVLHGRKGG